MTKELSLLESIFAQEWIRSWNKSQYPRDTLHANFQARQRTLTILA